MEKLRRVIGLTEEFEKQVLELPERGKGFQIVEATVRYGSDLRKQKIDGLFFVLGFELRIPLDAHNDL